MSSEQSKFEPVATPGSSKYGKRGKCMGKLLSAFNLSDNTRTVLEEAGDFSLASSTWNTYNTAERLLMKCRKDTGRKMEFPLTQEDSLEYIGWLLVTRKVKAATVNSYMAGIRQLHILQGMEPPVIKSELIKFILRGRQNKDNIGNRANKGRLPITTSVMKVLKNATREWDAPIERKLVFWSISTLAFFGAFRIHELLSKQETNFDPDFTLLTDDVKIKTQASSGKRLLEIRLKCPKESKTGGPVFVEVFETVGTLCPVKAFTRWTGRAIPRPGRPLFCDETGTPVTGKAMNSWLKDRLAHLAPGDRDKGTYSSHSFRIGLASTLAANGTSEEEIAAAGRWHSKAYEIYLKMPRVQRAAVANKIAKLKVLDNNRECVRQ